MKATYLPLNDGYDYFTFMFAFSKIVITPSDTTLFTQADGDVQIVQIRIKDSFVRNVAEETLVQNGDAPLGSRTKCDRIELVQTFQTRDPQIEAIAMMLLSELHQESFGSKLYVDSLANVLAVHLLRHHGTTTIARLQWWLTSTSATASFRLHGCPLRSGD
ncbi:MAG: hypothetical protein QNJ63_30810 [Calothrix sp. MO_192.B10]|nr:hypothetical protein [Calothrix sp. MO_192.B10]